MANWGRRSQRIFNVCPKMLINQKYQINEKQSYMQNFVFSFLLLHFRQHTETNFFFLRSRESQKVLRIPSLSTQCRGRASNIHMLLRITILVAKKVNSHNLSGEHREPSVFATTEVTLVNFSWPITECLVFRFKSKCELFCPGRIQFYSSIPRTPPPFQSIFP